MLGREKKQEVAVTSNSELIPLIKIATLDHVYQIVRKLFTRSIPNVSAISRKTTLFHNSLRKNYPGSINIIYCKGSTKPHLFESLPFHEKIPDLTKMSKEQFSLMGQEVL